jgi:RNA recognition motif-containing protein
MKFQLTGAVFAAASLIFDVTAFVPQTPTTFFQSSTAVSRPSFSTTNVNIVLQSTEEDNVAEAVEEAPKPAPAAVEEEEEELFTAYVVNLPYDATNQDLRETFSSCGEVAKVYMPMNRETGRSKGIAFVSMTTEAALEAAISSIHETEMMGRKIFVNKAKPRGTVSEKTKGKKLYVGNISYETTTDELIEYFTQFGAVKDCYAPTDQSTGLPRGFAFLTLAEEDADKAIEEADGLDFGGRTIEVKESLPRGVKAPKREYPNKAPKSRENEVKLYVGNLSFDTEEDTVREMFGEYGPVVDFYMPYDRYSGRARGFVFVTLEPENAARAVEELDGYELDGRILRVNEAQPKGWSNEEADDGSYEDDGSWGSEEY